MVKMIVGLGNPGPSYALTRHNVGFWWVDSLALSEGAHFRPEPRFNGDACRVMVDGKDCRLLKPATFMNRSGQAVGNMARFYKVQSSEILVVHDELDLPAGTVRLKQGGGHGGHNGLRDIIAHLGGAKDFLRLRLGIGHPGEARMVTNYVLGAPSVADRNLILEAIQESLRVLPLIVGGELQKAMHRLHSQ